MGSYQEVKIAHDLEGQVILDYKKDVTYIVNDGEDLHLQIIFPVNSPQKKYPCIVYMMSTTEKREDIYHNIPRLIQFAQRGFAVALMETPSQSSTYEEQINLIRSAVHYLNENAQEYHLEPDNMFIWRDGTHESQIQKSDVGEIVLKHTEYNTPIKAIVCFGGKEQMHVLNESLKLEIPPILMIPCEEQETLNLEFWTEDVFDVIEDFISNYIN